jgi:hypothetical protein
MMAPDIDGFDRRTAPFLDTQARCEPVTGASPILIGGAMIPATL